MSISDTVHCIFFILQGSSLYVALKMKFEGDVTRGEWYLQFGHLFYPLFSVFFTIWGIDVKRPTRRLVGGLITIIFLRTAIIIAQKMFILSWYFRSSKVMQIIIRSVIQNILKSLSVQTT